MELKKLRTKYGLSLEEMHVITGIPLRTLQAWDYGERKISPYLYRLMEFFLMHRRVDETLYEKGEKR